MPRQIEKALIDPPPPSQTTTISAFRMVFKRSYLEVKSMLEANLLRRFLNTDQFKSAKKQRENVQAMMDSPPLPAGVAAA